MTTSWEADRKATPAAAQEGGLEAVHEGRPEELEGIGHAHQAQEADGGDIHPVHREPGLHGLAGEGQGQARGEAQEEDGGEAVDGGKRGHVMEEGIALP
jgi:hypothetical protein